MSDYNSAGLDRKLCGASSARLMCRRFRLLVLAHGNRSAGARSVGVLKKHLLKMNMMKLWVKQPDMTTKNCLTKRSIPTRVIKFHDWQKTKVRIVGETSAMCSAPNSESYSELLGQEISGAKL